MRSSSIWEYNSLASSSIHFITFSGYLPNENFNKTRHDIIQRDFKESCILSDGTYRHQTLIEAKPDFLPRPIPVKLVIRIGAIVAIGKRHREKCTHGLDPFHEFGGIRRFGYYRLRSPIAPKSKEQNNENHPEEHQRVKSNKQRNRVFSEGQRQ